MTEPEQQVIEAARAAVEAIKNLRAVFLSGAGIEERDEAQFRQTNAIERLIYSIAALDRETQMHKSAEACQHMVAELSRLDREPQRIPNISCSECMNLSFDTHHWDYARQHGHHPMCSTQQQKGCAMRYSRCKCGKYEVWHSGERIATCSPCKECGTVPGYGPNDHPPVTDHEWAEACVHTYDGTKTLTVCRMCHRTKAEIEKQRGMSDETEPTKAGEGVGGTDRRKD